MPKAPLRAVAPNETPPPARKKSLAEAIEAGDYREILMAQRRQIAASIPNEKGPAVAALHRHLSLISKEIEALDAREAEEVEGAGAATPDEAWTGT